MDAREYLARKGIGQGREEERPNTLEEKAWERARAAGEHQPHAGTPHDWEDWERYHDDLAEGAESIEQKIDRDSHHHASERVTRDAVQHFTPTDTDNLHPGDAPQLQGAPWVYSTALSISLKVLAVLMPPLAVGLSHGGQRRVAVSLLLTLLGWVPGVIHAFTWLKRVLG
ncbi:YqaE/Pmp3 family membrane protein [Billgrantia montanilacus]|uniref:YqaE/Pmp3 family membrane protein n=1 Tax=Billgrantia montanilacus TaxID=2282305 RepID=A0A368U554_9GAMM|nr:YqaE/Pmp3 family membrane protein [Halomonas montanilacus]RCV91232.1 YqaE/Pmp3 family membrane protein [Halomonas montanilacus]